MGELLERRSFFQKNNQESRISFDQFNCQLTQSWKLALDQMGTIKTKEVDILPITNIFTGVKTFIPTDLITLRDLKGRRFFFTDSCSNSFHTSLERQSLLLSWIGDLKYEYLKLTGQIIIKHNFPRDLYLLIDKGDIYISYINKFFSSHIFLCLFTSKKNSENIFFAISSSGGYSAIASLLSSLNELCGSYKLTQENANNKNGRNDEYKNFYLKSNTQNTIKKFNVFQGTEIFSLDKWLNYPNGSRRKDIQIINSLTPDLYIFTNNFFSKNSTRNGIVTKLLSPHFFLNMKINNDTNFDNRFLQHFNITHYNKKRIPFP